MSSDQLTGVSIGRKRDRRKIGQNQYIKLALKKADLKSRIVESNCLWFYSLPKVSFLSLMHECMFFFSR